MPRREDAAPRVLVAEDDDAIRELLAAQLDQAGYLVREARDGHAALECWRGFKPDVAILDVNMPLLDGFGVLEVVRRRERGLHTPVMMLTARRSRADVDQARALGAQEYLAKPYDEQDLLRRVERLLKTTPDPASAPRTTATALSWD